MSSNSLIDKFRRTIPRSAGGILGLAIGGAFLYGAHSENKAIAADRDARCRELAPLVMAGDTAAWTEFTTRWRHRPCPYALIAPKDTADRASRN